MTPDALATTHGRAMTETKAWSAKDFADLLGQNGVFVVGEANSFALGRVMFDEAELLTIVTDPAHQKRGLGMRALSAFHEKAQRLGAATAFLEVSVENSAATALYQRAGWQEAGKRKAYYHLRDGRVVDALVMSRSLAD